MIDFINCGWFLRFSLNFKLEQLLKHDYEFSINLDRALFKSQNFPSLFIKFKHWLFSILFCCCNTIKTNHTHTWHSHRIHLYSLNVVKFSKYRRHLFESVEFYFCTNFVIYIRHCFKFKLTFKFTEHITDNRNLFKLTQYLI